MILISVIYLTTVFVYFYSLRRMLSSNIDLDIDKLGKVFVILVIGFLPFFNIIYFVSMMIEYFTFTTKLSPNEILKKILFIRERDERWR